MKKALTPEEKLAEKLRQQRLQEEADLQVRYYSPHALFIISISLLCFLIFKVTKETFGVIESTESIDAMNPTTQEEFNNLQEALIKKFQPLSSSVHYALFLENLMRSICASRMYCPVFVILSYPNRLYELVGQY